MIKLGQKVYFDPFVDLRGFSSDLNRGQKVTGEVVYINKRHNWFSVAFRGNQRISFMFSQLGKDVKISG